MNGFYKQFTEILKRHGYKFLRPGRGDHEIWSNGKQIATVDRGCKSRHTVNSQLRSLGISERI